MTYQLVHEGCGIIFLKNPLSVKALTKPPALLAYELHVFVLKILGSLTI